MLFSRFKIRHVPQVRFSIICSHSNVLSRVIKVQAHWKFKDSYCGSWEILKGLITWNMHHSESILFPFWAKGKGLSCWSKLQISDCCSKVHDRLYWFLLDLSSLNRVNIDRAHLWSSSKMLSVFANSDLGGLECSLIWHLVHTFPLPEVPLIDICLVTNRVEVSLIGWEAGVLTTSIHFQRE